jgi:signal transduction histidine kinase
VGVLWIRTREQKRLRDLREQIARDLHDDIGSSLGSIALMSEMAGRTTNSESLSEIHRLASDAAASMRSILWMVRETGTPDLARLLDALRSTATNAFPGIAFVSELHDPVPRIDLSVQRQIFLAFKEAVHNVSRHSKATSAAIHVHIHSGILHIQIRDNGCGFDPHGDHRGSGLANMHHRIRSLGGHIEITSTPETGTCLLFKVPVAK